MQTYTVDAALSWGKDYIAVGDKTWNIPISSRISVIFKGMPP